MDILERVGSISPCLTASIRQKNRRKDWRSHRPLYMGIVISAVFCLSALRRVRRFNFLCLHGVCGARQKSLQICKRRKPDEMRELHQIR